MDHLVSLLKALDTSIDKIEHSEFSRDIIGIDPIKRGCIFIIYG